MSVIKAGYRVSVRSWENDADAYNTEVVDGLDKEDVMFVVAFCEMFRSRNDRRKPGFGNMYEPNEAKLREVEEALRPLIEGNMSAVATILDCDEEDLAIDDDEDGGIGDIINELHGELFGYSEFYFRVFDTITIEHIPVEIHINDVTNEFAKG